MFNRLYRTTGNRSLYLVHTFIWILIGIESAFSATTTATQPNAGLLGILQIPEFQFLYANGDVSPAAQAAAPEYGAKGYASTYYGRIDPEGRRNTLDKWLKENGFKDPANSYYQAEYINASDLGFGRIMTCLDNKQVACYVKNYLDPKKSAKFAATVAMERMTGPAGSYVAFFVFDSNGKRINQIALDLEGPKSVPESCWACHGGGEVDGNFVGGNYLPFDIAALQDWPGHPTRAAQEEDLRNLNYIVWKDARMRSKNPAMLGLIESWYGGVPMANTSYSSAPPPKKWFSNASGASSADAVVKNRHTVEEYLYTDIYARYCRMCHVAQKLDWQGVRAEDFVLAAFDHICAADGRVPAMPHAEVTHKDFHQKKIHEMPELLPINTASRPDAVGASSATRAASSSSVSAAARVQSASAARATTSAPVSALREAVSRAAASASTSSATQANSTVISSSAIAKVNAAAAVLNEPSRFTAFEMLCEKLPLDMPSGHMLRGVELFASKGCSGCHTKGKEAQSFGGDLGCRGGWLRQDMGSINTAMKSIKLSASDIGDLSAYLDHSCQ